MAQENGYAPAAAGQPTAAALLSTYEKIAWQITVNGQTIKRILSLEIGQYFSAHHTFELRLYHTELEDPRTYRIERTRELLGKPLTVVLGTHNTADITRFSGIITEVAFEEKTGLYGEVILRGASPTILLESGPNMRSFLNKNLTSIVGEVLESVKGRLETSVQPRFTGNIEYTVQHGESHFAFLTRLAALHGEWFYYDGERMHFGRPGGQGDYELQYARHIESLQMGMRAVPMTFENIGYRAAEDQSLAQKSPDKVAGLNFYGDTAVEGSRALYAETSRRYSTLHAPDQGELTRSNTVATAALAAGTFSVRGTSRHPAPRPGLRLRVMMSGSEMGEYLVTKAVHTLDNVNNYSCQFEALAPDLEVLPVGEHIVLPRAEPQVATVTSNADPAGQGRVQVQMQWQEEDNTTPWIRVMTPDAGSSGVVSKNRGYVFIPEVGDQVMVGFERGNPDAPFVMGSLFHGSNGAGGGADNVTKSISTRSGNIITLNDADGSITVEDAGGSVYRMDGQGNVELTAPKTVTVNGTDILLNATNNLSLTAGNQLLANAMVQMLTTTPHLQQLVADYFHTVAGKALMTSHDGEIKIEAKQFLAAGEERMFLHSESAVVANSKGTVELRGEEGNSHINNAETHEVDRPPITAKCVVKFRPSDRWAGEYGFDWLREGDSGRRGDQWYGRTMGKHYISATQVQPDGNSYGGTFRPDLRMYDRKLRSYQCLTIGWKQRRRGQAYLYPIPVMTLMPGRSATLNLKIEIEERPERLTLEWENSAASAALEVNLQAIGDIRQGRYDKFNYLTIRCKQAFNTAHTLQVKADGQVCGAVRVLPNAGAAVRRLNVVFVSVITNINGTVQIGRPGADDTPFFRQSMNQALVDPAIAGPVRVDARGSGTNHEFRRRFCVRNAAGRYTINPNANAGQLRSYLEGLLQRQHGATYNGHYKMFFMGEQWPGLNGFSFFNTLFGVYFPSHQKATVAHETFHAMGVAHTFDGVSASARFTYKGKSTDNIMDYSHHDGIERVSLFRWQWKLLNANIR